MKPSRDTARAIRSGRRGAGFSMIELVIALAVLGFGLLAAALMQVRALTEGSRGRHSGDASAVARSYLEQIQRVPWTVLSAVEGAGYTDPNWAGATASVANQVDTPSGGTATEQTYTVQWNVSDVSVVDECLRNVDVRVRWNEQEIATPRQLVLSTRRYNSADPKC